MYNVIELELKTTLNICTKEELNNFYKELSKLKVLLSNVKTGTLVDVTAANKLYPFKVFITKEEYGYRLDTSDFESEELEGTIVEVWSEMIACIEFYTGVVFQVLMGVHKIKINTQEQYNVFKRTHFKERVFLLQESGEHITMSGKMSMDKFSIEIENNLVLSKTDTSKELHLTSVPRKVACVVYRHDVLKWCKKNKELCIIDTYRFMSERDATYRLNSFLESTKLATSHFLVESISSIVSFCSRFDVSLVAGSDKLRFDEFRGDTISFDDIKPPKHDFNEHNRPIDVESIEQLLKDNRVDMNVRKQQNFTAKFNADFGV